MTAKTSDFSGLLYYNPIAHGFNPIPQATFTGPDNMDEGATATWDIVTWNIPDGDVYWRIVPSGDNLNAGRFADGLTGTLPVVGNRTSISVTVSADSTTSVTGQSFDILLSKTLNGTVFAAKYGVGINDTSQGGLTGNDFFFAGDQNNWIINSGLNLGSSFSSPPPSNTSFTYPDGSYTGKTYNFDGTTWMASMNLKIGGSWTTNAITIDYWFYPTATNVQLISEADHPDVTSGYHYSVLEIDSSGYVHARFYNALYPSYEIVSLSPVVLNHWNHIWFQETVSVSEQEPGHHYFTLNNESPNTDTRYTRVKPTVAEYFVIGEHDFTKITATGRFQGKIGYLNIHDYEVASTWNDQHNRFRPASQFYTAQFNTEAPPNSGTFATFVWPSVLQNVIGWKMYGPGVPPGTTVISQSDNGVQTTMTVSPEIVYHAATYTFVAP